MHSRRQAWIKFGQIVFAGILVSGLSAQVSEFRPHVGIPDDWTHHHIKFSSAAIRQHPEIASREPRAALHLYREAFMAAAAARSQSAASTTAPHRDWSINFGAGRVQFGQYPAKWNADPNVAPSCTKDYVVYGLNVAGANGGQANLVGLTNLYSGRTNPLCPGLQPLFLFSYNMTTIPNGRILTSPVLSLDGKKVAFLETSTVAGAKGTVLHVLTVPTTIGANGTSTTAAVAAPGPPTMLSLTVNATNSDTRSSPWVDYPSDTMYVCLDDGKLYKVTGVFNGTPTLAGAPWPKTINLTSVFTSPVLDATSGMAFMGTGNARVYAVNVNNPTTVTPIQIGTTGALNSGVFDSPTIDATGSTIFAVTSNDTTGAAVVQASISTLLEVARVHIGEGSTGGTSVTIYDGDFDDAYFTNPSTGHLYMCGTGGAGDSSPWLYQLSFGGTGLLTGSTQFHHISTNAAARCGPITEFRNPNIGGGTDFFFWGVTRNCVGNSGCVMSMANGVVPATTPATEVGGASGIIVDNNSTAGGASSIYFSTEQVPLNAVKLTQQGLN